MASLPLNAKLILNPEIARTRPGCGRTATFMTHTSLNVSIYVFNRSTFSSLAQSIVATNVSSEVGSSNVDHDVRENAGHTGKNRHHVVGLANGDATSQSLSGQPCTTEGISAGAYGGAPSAFRVFATCSVGACHPLKCRRCTAFFLTAGSFDVSAAMYYIKCAPIFCRLGI